MSNILSRWQLAHADLLPAKVQTPEINSNMYKNFLDSILSFSNSTLYYKILRHDFQIVTSLVPVVKYYKVNSVSEISKLTSSLDTQSFRTVHDTKSCQLVRRSSNMYISYFLHHINSRNCIRLPT